MVEGTLKNYMWFAKPIIFLVDLESTICQTFLCQTFKNTKFPGTNFLAIIIW